MREYVFEDMKRFSGEMNCSSDAFLSSYTCMGKTPYKDCVLEVVMQKAVKKKI